MSDSQQEEEQNEERTLTRRPLNTISFGIGHFFNDLCACMWFTYLMLYLQKVLQFDSWYAGMCMLIGQVTDAICTPIMGIAIDKKPLKCLEKMGRRKSWHLLGTLCVAVSFSFIFNRCLPCGASDSQLYQLLYYIPLIMLFQFGWATVQVSHLSLIPELSCDESQRTTLNSLRFGFTVIANMCVFGIMLAFLSHGHLNKVALVSPHDIYSFRDCALIVVAAGCYAAALFHFGTKEPVVNKNVLSRTDSNDQLIEIQSVTWKQWFRHAQFYQVALIYMASRLFINVSQVYYPFYIQWTQDFHKQFVAIFPLVVYVSAFCTSTILSIPAVNKRLNRKCLLVFGVCVGVFCCVWIWTPWSSALLGYQMYPLSVLMGLSQAILLVSSLALTADLIGVHSESGAFVYGAMSFCDKLSNGITYQVIEVINPVCRSLEPHLACSNFYRTVMSTVPGAALVVCFIALLSLARTNIGVNEQVDQQEDSVDDPIL